MNAGRMLKRPNWRTSLVVQRVKTSPSHAGGVGLILGGGAQIHMPLDVEKEKDVILKDELPGLVGA